MSDKDRFVSANELEEARKRRQEEWDRVRKADDPKEAPEEEYDHRTLFERLREQSDKKQEEVEEAHRLKHMVRGLDEDESKFLEHVDEVKIREQKARVAEEKRLLEQIKQSAGAPVDLAEVARAELRSAISPPAKSQCGKAAVSKQAQLLGAAVKRKRPSAETAAASSGGGEPSQGADKQPARPPVASVMRPVAVRPSAARVVGTLPGVSAYGSSESEDSSDSEHSGGHVRVAALQPAQAQQQCGDAKAAKAARMHSRTSGTGGGCHGHSAE